ncbi:MAG: coproporphyrinogen dehydrogenase HemZ, partial [Clostridia bacterium]|nr:coproporphyrinogen dehydrogenase HemZ [Clostridia bacterium]
GAGGISKRVFGGVQAAGNETGQRIERAANVKDLREYIARTGEMRKRKRRLFEV